VRLKAQIIRELDRLEVLLEQLKTVEAERDALLKPASDEAASPAAMLARLKGIGPETAAVLWSEGLFPTRPPLQTIEKGDHTKKDGQPNDCGKRRYDQD